MTITKKDHWQLTPHPNRSCWKKKRNGVIYYVGKGTQRYSEEDYRRAWDEWQSLEAKLIEEEEQARNFTITGPGPNDWKVSEYRRDQQLKRGHRAGLITTGQGLSQQQEQQQVPQDKTVAGVVGRFLDMKRSQAKTGQKSVGRYANLASALAHFSRFVGEEKDANVITALTLSSYYTKQLEEIGDGSISESYGRDRFVIAKQFIRWAWEQGACELPRNIDSRELTISVTAGDVEPMPVETLRTRIAAAEGKLKLELMLMANCGFYQSDCGELLHTEINWKAGTITRKRTKKQKGEKAKNVPSVTWYLWPSTLGLLRDLATTDSPYALATRDGKQTVRDGFNSDGKPVRNDSIGQKYRKFEVELVEKLDREILPKLKPEEIEAKLGTGELEKVKGKLCFARWPLKHVRKTSASALYDNPEYSRYVQYFLGQAPESVADKHYVKPSEEQMKAACKWLGEFLRLAHVPITAPSTATPRPAVTPGDNLGGETER